MEDEKKVEECESLEVEKLPESIFWDSFGCDVANLVMLQICYHKFDTNSII